MARIIHVIKLLDYLFSNESKLIWLRKCSFSTTRDDAIFGFDTCIRQLKKLPPKHFEWKQLRFTAEENFPVFLSYTVRQVSNRTASINQIITMTKVPDIKKK
jgi:hypothetical protein